MTAFGSLPTVLIRLRDGLIIAPSRHSQDSAGPSNNGFSRTFAHLLVRKKRSARRCEGFQRDYV